MKLPLNKKRIAWFFQYNSLLLILVTICSYLLFDYSLSAIDAYKSYERMDFFIEATDVKDKEFFSDLKQDIPEILYTGENVYSPDFSALSTVYAAFGTDCDIMVLKESDYSDMKEAISTACLPLSDELLEEIGAKEDMDYYSFEETRYAIKLYAKTDAPYNETYPFTKWLDFKEDYEDYYLSFQVNSDNLGSYHEGSHDDLAIRAVKFIFGRYLS